MAKFSVPRDGEDDDDCDYDEEDFGVSTPEPKRRRLSSGGTSSSSSPLPNTDTLVVSSITYLDRLDNEIVSKEETSFKEKRDLEFNGRVVPQDQSSTDGSISVVLSDPDVLDCPVCFDPLTIPVYQCENGHIACSTCCTSMSHKCPSCFEKIGHSRCRAIEKILESVQIQCSYHLHGCKSKVGYSNKLIHEETCPYAPYHCPFQTGCTFRGCSRRLALHLSQQHGNSLIQFRFNIPYHLSFHTTEEKSPLILQEERSGAIFVVLNVGDKMAVKVVTRPPGCLGNRFPYGFVVRKGGSCLRFQSFTEEMGVGVGGGLGSEVDDDDDRLSVDFFPVPKYLFGSSGRLKFELCIWSSKWGSNSIDQGITLDVGGRC